MDYYGQQKKHFPVLALSKGVFDKPKTQQVAPLDLPEVTPVTSVCNTFYNGSICDFL